MPLSTNDPDLSKRALDVLENWAKISGALAALGLFFSKVLKPYNSWRRRQLAMMMREILAEELARLNTVAAREEERDDKLDLILLRQDELYEEVDLFMQIAQDNRDRHDERDELLSATGLSAGDRRQGGDRRKVDAAFDALEERRLARRRHQAPGSQS